MASDLQRKPTVADFPFDNANADSDLVLRSSDNIDFYVHKPIMKIASPIFADMFIVARDGLTDKADESHSDLPVVLLAESGTVIDALLRMCYPVIEKKPESLAEVAEILKAALKYDMPKIIANTRIALLSYAAEEPILVYVIACTLNSEHEASAAARLCKEKFCSQSTPPCASQSRSHSRINAQRNARGHFAFCNGFCQPFSSTDAGMIYQAGMQQGTAGHAYRLLRYFAGETITFCTPPHPNDEYSLLNPEALYKTYSFTSFPNPDITIESLDGIRFPAHKNILLFASATSILNQLQDTPIDAYSLPTVHLEEDGKTLTTLLQLCYPFADGEMPQGVCSASLAALVCKTAEKYGMLKAARSAKFLMMRHIKNDPVQVFFAASRYGYVEEAEVAAVQCLTLLGNSLNVAYSSDMEFVSAEVYSKLLKRWHESKAGQA